MVILVRKLNNKGFAISTVIYGLSIMGILLIAMLMSEMATIRSNTKQLSKSIEEDLNNYSRTSTTFKANSITPEAQEFYVPEGQAGWYRIELWGAQGGANGGYGAYTAGVIELNEGDTLYFYVGKHSDTSGSGQETDVRLNGDGGYSDENAANTRIMVAAGGGQHEDAFGGTLYGGSTSMKSLGGYINSEGSPENPKDYSLLPVTTTTKEDEKPNPTNGTLIGYPKDFALSTLAQPAVGTTNKGIRGSSGGGDGYYPSSSPNIGGISFISGYAGCRAKNMNGQVTNSPTYTHYKSVFNESTGTWETTGTGKLWYFVDGIMIAGTNKGDGLAKIERVAIKDEEHKTLTRNNTKFNGVRTINTCVTPSSQATKTTVVAITKGVAETKTENGGCVSLTLSSQKDVDEIAVFHTPVGKDYKDLYISVNGYATYIFQNSLTTDYSETETVTGIRATAYQYDYEDQLPPKGNYYILPVLSENKVITAAETAEEDVNKIGIDYLKGSSNQKWSIERITNTKLSPGYISNNANTYEYKITELSRYKSLEIYEDENKLGNSITTAKFNSYARNEPQIWKIIPDRNGTYKIQAAIKTYDGSDSSGNIIPQTNPNVENYDKLFIGAKGKEDRVDKKNDTPRFKLIPIDYSSSK